MRALAIAALTLAFAGCGNTHRHEPVTHELPSLAAEMPHRSEAVWTEAVVEQLAPSWPDDHRRPFLAAVAPVALRSSAEQCLPASVTVAQAALESGWGRSDKALGLNNLFGIKAAEGEAGEVAPTWEVVRGQRVDVSAKFRAFASWGESVVEHDRRLVEHPAYAAARAHRQDWRAFVDALAPVYATDPAYAERVRSIVQQYGLEALDAPALKRARSQGRCG